MRFTGSVSVRPVRLGFLIPPDDLGLASRVAGGALGVRMGWSLQRHDPLLRIRRRTFGIRPYHREGGLDVARGYINFFEPDLW